MASDPEFAARVREIRREANKRYQREDEAIKARREYQAAWWQERFDASPLVTNPALLII